jgi:dipeptidyl aminopeptidase/acylaminoacyl peptidase
MKEIQARIDKLLPATLNVLETPVRPEVPLVLVLAYSDVDRGRFLLFDSESNKLTELGRIQRDIDARALSRTELVHYPARDGLPIPAWLTVPEGAKGRKAPLVVLVSSDPWSRRLWNWQPEVQFLASRGYAVMQPEARGSAGHGASHFRKGLKQWGLAMQDDLADGARWAIAQGMADPERICIAGSSYGGYATLMGLAREPSLFKCGVAWSAITGVDVLHATSWRDPITPFAVNGMPALQGMPDLYGMAALVGDPVADAAQWQAASPIEQAAHITQPLLLLHGGADWRVPIAQAAKLRDAIAAGNPRLEWVEYENDGHYWMQGRTRLNFWTRVEKFLQRNIGDPAQP